MSTKKQHTFIKISIKSDKYRFIKTIFNKTKFFIKIKKNGNLLYLVPSVFSRDYKYSVPLTHINIVGRLEKNNSGQQTTFLQKK